MNTIIESILVILLGWVAGILVNYISDVLPVRRKLTAPFCRDCQIQFSLMNYILWPRRCNSCGKRRSRRVWIIEIVYMLLAIKLWQSPPDTVGFWLGLLVIMYFGVVIVIDLEYRLIMHPVSLMGVGIGIYIGVITNGFLYTMIGGIAGFGIMWLFYMFGTFFISWISKRRGQHTDEVALGFGDVNLSGVLGLMLGWPGILLGLIVAILFGGIFSLVYLIIMLIARRYQLFSALPYGPFLIAGAIMMIFFKEVLLSILGG